MDLAAGIMVTPNVRLVKLLGQGGMGCVWTADHLTLETQVAVKFIHQEVATADPTLVSRFKREAGLAAKIKSPHVVQMLDHGLMTDGTPYIVMELLDGESLGQRLEREGRISLRQTGIVVDQVCKALSKAHEAGIVHRDLKPDNLFLIDSGYELFVKVLDFGIAKHAHAKGATLVTATDAVAGTPHFMSPEQLLSTKNVDGNTDLWALAVVTYAAIAGRLPFAGETMTALSLTICMDDFPPISSIVAGLPAQLDAWFERALHKDIECRFLNAFELAAAFQQSMAGALITGVATHVGGGAAAHETNALGSLANPSTTAEPVEPSPAISTRGELSVLGPSGGQQVADQPMQPIDQGTMVSGLAMAPTPQTFQRPVTPPEAAPTDSRQRPAWLIAVVAASVALVITVGAVVLALKSGGALTQQPTTPAGDVGPLFSGFSIDTDPAPATNSTKSDSSSATPSSAPTINSATTKPRETIPTAPKVDCVNNPYYRKDGKFIIRKECKR